MLHLNLVKQFAKKENSTKRPPSGSLTLGLQGILKEPCSVMNPVVRIERLPLDAVPFEYTYALWVEAERFYFIEDWVWANGLWEIHMKEDVLATYKTIIGNQSEYVLRTDSTTDYNGEITDITYPATTDISSSTVENASPFAPDSISTGCYIVGIISGDQQNAVGAITYYLMDSTEFGTLKDTLFSNTNLEIMDIIDSQGQQIVQDLSKEVLKTLYNPYQYIASCMWFPIYPADVVNKTAVTQIKIGWWEYTLSGYVLTHTSMSLTENAITLVNHPQASTRGDYLNYSPFTKRTIYGKYGAIPLDTSFFKSGDSLLIRYYIDLITGKCRVDFLRQRTLSTDFITSREFLLGVPIQIAQVGIDYLAGVATAVSTSATAVGQLTRLDIGGAIATEVNGIYNMLQSSMPQIETSGSNGSFLSGTNQTKVVSLFYQIVDEDISHRGRPLCEIRTLNTLSGFILCAEGDMDISCFDNERKEIVNHMTNGFFWE